MPPAPARIITRPEHVSGAFRAGRITLADEAASGNAPLVFNDGCDATVDRVDVGPRSHGLTVYGGSTRIGFLCARPAPDGRPRPKYVAYAQGYLLLAIGAADLASVLFETAFRTGSVGPDDEAGVLAIGRCRIACPRVKTGDLKAPAAGRFELPSLVLIGFPGHSYLPGVDALMDEEARSVPVGLTGEGAFAFGTYCEPKFCERDLDNRRWLAARRVKGGVRRFDVRGAFHLKEGLHAFEFGDPAVGGARSRLATAAWNDRLFGINRAFDLGDAGTVPGPACTFYNVDFTQPTHGELPSGHDGVGFRGCTLNGRPVANVGPAWRIGDAAGGPTGDRLGEVLTAPPVKAAAPDRLVVVDARGDTYLLPPGGRVTLRGGRLDLRASAKGVPAAMGVQQPCPKHLEWLDRGGPCELPVGEWEVWWGDAPAHRAKLNIVAEEAPGRKPVNAVLVLAAALASALVAAVAAAPSTVPALPPRVALAPVAASAPVLPAPVLDDLGVAGKPDLGLPRVVSYRPYHDATPEQLRAFASGAAGKLAWSAHAWQLVECAPLGSTFVLEIEDLPLAGDDRAVERTVRLVRGYVADVRARRPDLLVGVYGALQQDWWAAANAEASAPAQLARADLSAGDRAYWVAIPAFERARFAREVSAVNDRLARGRDDRGRLNGDGVFACVDVVVCSLYLPYPNASAEAHEAYARWTVAEAARVGRGKPVLAYFWSFHHVNGLPGPRVAPATLERAVRAGRRAAGATPFAPVLWDGRGPGQPWEPADAGAVAAAKRGAGWPDAGVGGER